MRSGSANAAVCCAATRAAPASSTYRVLLAGEVDTANVEAGVHEEVLRIQVHKTEQAKPRRIAITAG